MNLTGPKGSFALFLLGYQFPNLTAEPYDSNWLRVRVAVGHPRGSWTATDPCLLTYEAASLADWLDAVALGTAVDSELRFLEPCLWFELRDGTGSAPTVRVYFRYEFRPPWARDFEDDETALDLPVDEGQFRIAAAALRLQTREYPQRAER